MESGLIDDVDGVQDSDQFGGMHTQQVLTHRHQIPLRAGESGRRAYHEPVRQYNGQFDRCFHQNFVQDYTRESDHSLNLQSGEIVRWALQICPRNGRRPTRLLGSFQALPALRVLGTGRGLDPRLGDV